MQAVETTPSQLGDHYLTAVRQLSFDEAYGHSRQLLEALGRSHGGDAVIATVDRFALPPHLVAPGNLIPKAVEADRGEVLPGIAPHKPAGQPAAHRCGARDPRAAHPVAAKRPVHPRHRADKVGPVRREGRQTLLRLAGAL